MKRTPPARLIGLRGSPSFSGVKDVREALARAERGGMLNPRELLTIAGLLTNSRRVREYYEADQGEGTRPRPDVRLAPRQPLFRGQASRPPSSPRTRSPTPPAPSWRISAVTSVRQAPRADRSCRRSSPRPATRARCRRRSSRSATGASSCPSRPTTAATSRALSTTSPPRARRSSSSRWASCRRTTSSRSWRPRRRRRSSASSSPSPPRRQALPRRSYGTMTFSSTSTSSLPAAS